MNGEPSIGELITRDPEIQQIEKDWKENLDCCWRPFQYGLDAGIEGYKVHLREWYKRELEKKNKRDNDKE